MSGWFPSASLHATTNATMHYQETGEFQRTYLKSRLQIHETMACFHVKQPVFEIFKQELRKQQRGGSRAI